MGAQGAGRQTGGSHSLRRDGKEEGADSEAEEPGSLPLFLPTASFMAYSGERG